MGMLLVILGVICFFILLGVITKNERHTKDALGLLGDLFRMAVFGPIVAISLCYVLYDWILAGIDDEGVRLLFSVFLAWLLYGIGILWLENVLYPDGYHGRDVKRK